MLRYMTMQRTRGSMSFLTSREQLAPQGIGKPVRRREDARLLTGGGRFADDTSLPDQAYAYMVRSPHAHARSVSIGTREAGPARERAEFFSSTKRESRPQVDSDRRSGSCQRFGRHF